MRRAKPPVPCSTHGASMHIMIQLHPRFDTGIQGEPATVQLPLADYQQLVLTAFASGEMTVGEAARALGMTRPAFSVFAAKRGVNTCTYTLESIRAELARL